MRAPLALALALGLGLALRAAAVDACAVLPIGGDPSPKLAHERVIVLYDEATRVEQFIREVQFDQASAAFAFVVPTPGKPAVAAVTDPPFARFATMFPIEPPPDPNAKGAIATPVEVVSSQRVGSFVATVLAADDARALRGWLDAGKIALPPGADAWLAHYVALHFYFTAFRYDAPAQGKPAAMKSETVRLAFATDAPFYPYAEPARAGGAGRQLLVWLVSRSAREAAARRTATGAPARWAAPWEAGVEHERPAADVRRALGGALATLVPDGGDLVIDTFIDGRGDRDGFGDVLFPKRGDVDAPAFAAVAARLHGDLARGITDGAAAPNELADEARFRVPKGASGCACRAAGGAPSGPDSSLFVAVFALAAAVRRRRPA